MAGPGLGATAERECRSRRSRPTQRRGTPWCDAPVPWHCVRVSDSSIDLPQAPSGWVTLPDLAERLEVPVTKVHQMIRDGALIAVRRDGVLRVPAELIAGRNVIKHLPGVLTLLRDAGYSDEEALRWLYSPDDTLPGTPAAALAGDGATEVKRRAQALGF
jgi:Rv2175c C-terminal domain of unknown function